MDGKGVKPESQFRDGFGQPYPFLNVYKLQLNFSFNSQISLLEYDTYFALKV